MCQGSGEWSGKWVNTGQAASFQPLLYFTHGVKRFVSSPHSLVTTTPERSYYCVRVHIVTDTLRFRNQLPQVAQLISEDTTIETTFVWCQKLMSH